MIFLENAIVADLVFLYIYIKAVVLLTFIAVLSRLNSLKSP